MRGHLQARRATFVPERGGGEGYADGHSGDNHTRLDTGRSWCWALPTQLCTQGITAVGHGRARLQPQHLN